MPALDAPIADRQLADPYKPVVWEEYEAEKALRAEQRAKKQPLLRECLDYERAAELEQAKPKFYFNVVCDVTIPDERTGRPVTKTEARTVRAQNANDAWAVFCDNLQHWPSRHAAQPKITKAKQAG